MLGSLSRATKDLAEESVENQEAAEKLFDEQISAAHDDQWAMRVADSIGQSAAGTVTSMLNPALGMSLIYSQTFQASRAEYQSVAHEPGLDASDEAADRYAHEQAMVILRTGARGAWWGDAGAGKRRMGAVLCG